jgi:hypothetical protein
VKLSDASEDFVDIGNKSCLGSNAVTYIIHIYVREIATEDAASMKS